MILEGSLQKGRHEMGSDKEETLNSPFSGS